MKTLLVVLVAVVGCSSVPTVRDWPSGTMAHFNGTASEEWGHDKPCQLADYRGGPATMFPGWHQCQMQEGPPACCPDGMSCDGDDFVPHTLSPGEQHMCRPGKTGFGRQADEHP